MDAAAEYLEARGKDNTTDMDDIADRIPSAPSDHKLAWLREDKSDPQYA